MPQKPRRFQAVNAAIWLGEKMGPKPWLVQADWLVANFGSWKMIPPQLKVCIYGRIWLSWFCCFIFFDLSHLRCRSCWRFSCSKFVAAQWFGLFPDLSHEATSHSPSSRSASSRNFQKIQKNYIHQASTKLCLILTVLLKHTLFPT